MVPPRLSHPPPASVHCCLHHSPISVHTNPPVSGKFWLKSTPHPPCSSLAPASVREMECQARGVGDVYTKPQQTYCSPLSSQGGGENHSCKFPQQHASRPLLLDSSPLARDLRRERISSLSASAGWKWVPAAPAEGTSSPQAWGRDPSGPPTPPPPWLFCLPAGVPITLPSQPPGSLGSQEALNPPGAHSTTTLPDL